MRDKGMQHHEHLGLVSAGAVFRDVPSLGGGREWRQDEPSPLHGVSGAQRLFPTTDAFPWSVGLRQPDLPPVSAFGLWL